jgi:hypothetical protein
VEYVPGRHFEQKLEPERSAHATFRYVGNQVLSKLCLEPIKYIRHKHSLPEELVYVPLLHAWQDVAPVTFEIKPSSQLEHDDKPNFVLYLPVGQALQKVDPCSANFPKEHKLQNGCIWSAKRRYVPFSQNPEVQFAVKPSYAPIPSEVNSTKAYPVFKVIF